MSVGWHDLFACRYSTWIAATRARSHPGVEGHRQPAPQRSHAMAAALPVEPHGATRRLLRTSTTPAGRPGEVGKGRSARADQHRRIGVAARARSCPRAPLHRYHPIPRIVREMGMRVDEAPAPRSPLRRPHLGAQIAGPCRTGRDRPAIPQVTCARRDADGDAIPALQRPRLEGILRHPHDRAVERVHIDDRQPLWTCRSAGQMCPR